MMTDKTKSVHFADEEPLLDPEKEKKEIDSFLRAIKKKNFVEVQKWLDSNHSPYVWSDKQEKSSFHVACEFFDEDIFKILIRSAQTLSTLFS